MDERLLIELLEDFTDQNNEQKRDALLERCLYASNSDLEEFFDDLSQLFESSPDTYLFALKTFISHIRSKFSQVALTFDLQAKWNATFSNFSSQLITVVIIKNLHHSNIPGFGEFLRSCIELLWSINRKLASQIMKKIFSAILVDGIFEVFVSGASGRRCLKCMLFDFNMVEQIERGELLKAVDIIASLVEKFSEHKEIIPQMSKSLSIYEACTELLKNLNSTKQTTLFDRKNSLPPKLSDMIRLDEEGPIMQHRSRRQTMKNDLTTLSNNDRQYFSLLEMGIPQKRSDLPNYLRALEQRKIDLFQDLMKIFSHASYLSKEGPTTSDRVFRLPFEFNDGDKLGQWDILLSEDTINDMRRLKSPLVIKEVMKKLGRVSSGEWGKHNLQCVAWDKHGMQNTDAIPVYEIELPNNDGLRILWQVDYGFSVRSRSLTQLIKVWAVTANDEQIRKILGNLSIVHKVYTSKQSHWCVVKQIGEDEVILPISFGDEEETKSSEEKLRSSHDIDDESLLEVHKMLVTNKFVPLSTNLYKSLALGGLNFTFQVSKKEYEIITNSSSSIVIGRSGTGKTTCIIFRQVASYLNSKLYKSPSSCHVRQIFITVSSSLRYRVKEYFNRLRDSAELAGRKMTMTQYHEYVKNKEEEGNIDVTDYIMFDEKEEEELDNIPNSFRRLTDDHFPLFITYDKFSKMLQGTFGIEHKNLFIKQKLDELNADNIDAYEEDETEFHERSSFINIADIHFVDYEVFRKRYWPYLKRYRNQRFDCNLVYSEFSIIKGSNPEVKQLSRDEYRMKDTRKYAGSFNRDHMYDLYQKYERLKARKRDYDSIDRALAILNYAKTRMLGGPHIHEVYIDECQDNQIADIALMFEIFNDADAIFLAGDIAQCIAQGSSFRFKDLRDLMRKWESSRTKANYGQYDVNPKQFELDMNYRSHNGILQLASSVIDLIRKFFPGSIDKLSSERGEVGGPRPIIFDGFQGEKYFKIFSAGEQMANYIEFGAEQVIIVRNYETKSRIKKIIGKAGLVMTVFETKGMEFNDVLLYNFFTDSPARKKWKDINEDSEVAYILCSELKHLYVAITRARQHIWICDDNAEYSGPIREHWVDLGLVNVIKSEDEINTLSILAKKGTSYEWDQRGKDLFELRQYEDAIYCFEKSGNKRGRELAIAYNLRQIARDSINDSDDYTIKQNFIKAAKAFKDCSRPDQAALCYQDVSMWHRAGKQFEKAMKYTEAVLAYKNDNDYEKVIDLMQNHRKQIDEKIFRRITRLVNIHYRRENNKEMSDKALSILSTQKEKIELLKDHAPEEFLEACKKLGQLDVAAEDLCSRGEYREAANMLMRSDNEKDIFKALECLLQLCRLNVLKMTVIGTKNQRNTQDLIHFLSDASGIFTKIKSQSLKKSMKWKILVEEFQLYIYYLKGDLNSVYKCMEFFKRNNENVAEFHAINVWLQIPQSDIQVGYWRKRLQCLLRLCDLTFPFIAPRKNNNDIFNKTFENIFFINEVENCPQKRKIFLDNPLIHLIDENIVKDLNDLINENIAKDLIDETKDVTDHWHIYGIYDVYQTISKFLASHIYKLIWDADQRGRNIPNIGETICNQFTYCRQPNHCRKHHVIPTPSVLYQRLTLACLQYAVVQKLILVYHRRILMEEQSKEVRGLQRFWAEKLIEHIRYQSPQTSCPEVTQMVISKFPYHVRNGLMDLAHKKWFNEFNKMFNEFKEASNFEAMLKYMLILQQLRDRWGIDKFCWEMRKSYSYPINHLPTGFECDKYGRAIPVGRRLSLFFSSLYSNRVIESISHMSEFIRYTIDKAQDVNLITLNAFGDITFFMEFTISLIFASSPSIYYDFCLPRSYLVNYFKAFTAKPLDPSNKHTYDRDNYNLVIKNSFDQIRQLLDIVIHRRQFYSTIFLRLIRLLVLIGLNESTFASASVLNLFKQLNEDPYYIKMDRGVSKNIKEYLGQKHMRGLLHVLLNDLKETGCDDLVVVFYNWGGVSRFSKLGITKLMYTSTKEFHSALQQINASVINTEENSTITVVNQQLTKDNEQNTDLMSINFTSDNDNEDENDDQLEVSKETQAWFHHIHGSTRAQQSAKKIQAWFRFVCNREKSRQHNYDPILNKIYNETMVFCHSIMEEKEKEKEKKAARKYNILLRGYTVDVVVELIKMQGKMDATKNKLQKSINNSSDVNKIESCLELDDELRYNHYKNVKQILKSLSINENSEKHKETNIRWLKTELRYAKDVIDQVQEWVDRCNAVIKL